MVKIIKYALIINFQLLVSQSVLLDDKTSGFGIAFSTATVEKITINMATFGLSINGVVDLNLSFGSLPKSRLSDAGNYYERSSNIIASSIGFYSEPSELNKYMSTGLVLGYQIYNRYNGRSDYGSTDMSSKTYSLTLDLYKFLKPIKHEYKTMFNVSSTVGYSIFDFRYEYRNRNSGSTNIVMDIFISIIQSWRFSKRNAVALQLGIGKGFYPDTNTSVNSIGGSLSLVLGTETK